MTETQTTTENLGDLYAALMDAVDNLDRVEWAELRMSDEVEIRLWIDDDHDFYYLIGDALDEDQNPFPGFMWCEYVDRSAEELEDDYIGSEGYAETVAEAVDYLMTRMANRSVQM